MSNDDTVRSIVLTETIDYAVADVSRALSLLNNHNGGRQCADKAATILSNLIKNLPRIGVARCVLDDFTELNDALSRVCCIGDKPTKLRDGTVIRNVADIREQLDVLSANGAAMIVGDVPAGLPASESKWHGFEWDIARGVSVTGELDAEGRVKSADLEVELEGDDNYVVNFNTLIDLIAQHVRPPKPQPDAIVDACRTIVEYIDNMIVPGTNVETVRARLKPLFEDAGIDFDLDIIDVNDSRTLMAVQAAVARKLTLLDG